MGRDARRKCNRVEDVVMRVRIVVLLVGGLAAMIGGLAAGSRALTATGATGVALGLLICFVDAKVSRSRSNR